MLQSVGQGRLRLRSSENGIERRREGLSGVAFHSRQSSGRSRATLPLLPGAVHPFKSSHHPCPRNEEPMLPDQRLLGSARGSVTWRSGVPRSQPTGRRAIGLGEVAARLEHRST